MPINSITEHLNGKRFHKDELIIGKPYYSLRMYPSKLAFLSQIERYLSFCISKIAIFVRSASFFPGHATEVIRSGAR